MFPNGSNVSGGTDWINSTPFIATDSTGADTSNRTIVNISGKGILTGAYTRKTTSGNAFLTIVADGVTILNDFNTISSTAPAMFSLSLNVRFKKTLTVSHRSGDTAGAASIISYVLL